MGAGQMSDADAMAVDALPKSPLILRREIVGVKNEAREIIERAEREAEGIRMEARRQAQQDRHQGHAEGVKDGRAEAARLLAEASATVDAFYEAREQEFTDLAFAIAYRLIGELPEQEQMARVARAALGEHRGGVKIMLRVGPGTAGPLRDALRPYDPEGRVDIETDETAPPGSCTLLHDRGRSSIGLLDQFRALMADVRTTK
jgi:type III secretion system HrpE/YscL family protein